MNSHRFKLYRTYSISFTSSNVGKCFWSWILKDCIKVQEKKRKFCLVFPSSTKREFRYFHVVVGQRRQRNLQKKAWCTCKVVVLLTKPIAFLPFSLPSASSLLKLPINSNIPRKLIASDRGQGRMFVKKQIRTPKATVKQTTKICNLFR